MIAGSLLATTALVTAIILLTVIDLLAVIFFFAETSRSRYRLVHKFRVGNLNHGDANNGKLPLNIH